MIEPYRSQSFLEQVLSDLPSTFVSGRLSTPLCFPFNATLLIQYVLHLVSKTLRPSLWRECINKVSLGLGITRSERGPHGICQGARKPSHNSEGALAPTTMSAIVLSFSTALVRAFHTVSNCVTICLPYSLSNSLRELPPVAIRGRLWFSASSDWDDRAHV